MKNIVTIAIFCGFLMGCAGAQATRTSQNTIQIDASAAPACGGGGAAKVAARAAAIETIKAGYDRYIIVGGAAMNNVTATQLPGQFNTYGTASYHGGYGSYQSTTMYTPGPTIVAGSHDKALSVVMLRPGDPGFKDGIDARSELGSNWREAVQKGIMNCL